MTPRGRELLHSVETAVESYNATIVYDGASLGFQGIGLFGRGGVELPVPSAQGPSQLFGYDHTIVPGNQSVVQLAVGSTLPYTNWNDFLINADANGTHLTHSNADTDIDVVGDVEMTLSAGSAYAVLTEPMSMLPTGGSLTVQGSRWLVSNGTLLQPNAATPVLTVVPAARGSISSAEGLSVSVAEWNRHVLWTSSYGTILYDTATGRTDLMNTSATVGLSNGSPIIRHGNASLVISQPETLIVQAAGGWAVGNGSIVTAGGGATRVAVTAIPAAGSSVRVGAGSELTVNDWSSYMIRLNGASVELENAARAAASELPDGAGVSLGAGTALAALTDGVEFLPSKTGISVQGSSWTLPNNTLLAPDGGNVAMTVVLTPGSLVRTPSHADVAVGSWNRYTLWAGPADTVLYDAVTGTATALPDGTSVTLEAGAPLSYHADSTLLPAPLQVVVDGTQWRLSNGTRLSAGGSVAALTAVPAFLSSISLANGTTITVRDWYRYVMWAGASQSYLYDTTTGAAFPVPPGSAMSLTRLSLLIGHNSHTRVNAEDATLTVLGGTLVYGNGSRISAAGSSGQQQQIIVLPTSSAAVRLGTTFALSIDGTAPYIAWTGGNGAYLYDTRLLAGYRLAAGSEVALAAGSRIIVHDSGTRVLTAATTMSVANRTWSFSNGVSLRLDGSIVGLVAAPADLSRLTFTRPWSLTLNGASRYGIWAGQSGTLLYDVVLQASFKVADGSTVRFAGGSTITARNGSPEPLRSGSTMTVTGSTWRFENGTTVDGGAGTGSTEQAVMGVHVASIDRVDDEVDRSCAVDFTDAQYQANPYSYDYAAVQRLLLGLPLSDFSTANIAPRVAAAAYGYDAGGPDVSGYNASLLVAGFPAASWEDRGRPAGVVVTCRATTVPATTSVARGVNMVLLDVAVAGNVAKLRGGAITVDGGYGRVLLDGLRVSDNTVVDGNGGGMSVHQSGEVRNMQLEVYVTSSVFSRNRAAVGSGGGVYLGSEIMHQQVVMLNTTLDGNTAAVGGGLSVVKHVSVELAGCTVSNNTADSSNLGSSSAVEFANQQNLGSGGGVMASLCNELQLTSGTVVRNNSASSRGGGLASSSCALLLLNETVVAANGGQSAGGVYVWNALQTRGTYRPDNPVGASIAVVLRSDFLDNRALNTTASDTEMEGFGGGFMVNGHVSTLLADSNFEGNQAAMQGGSIFIESVCDLDSTSWFLARNASSPTAFKGMGTLLDRTVEALQWPRPKFCWGTVVYLPRFFRNEAARSGGALFASHPEALSLVCDAVDNPLSINYGAFDESKMADKVLDAMKKASFQVLDNRIVQSCYKDEIMRLFNQSRALTGTQLSTLEISDNRAKGYGYLIAIIPSKLRILEVQWTGNTSNVASGDVVMVNDTLINGMDAQLAMLLSAYGTTGDVLSGRDDNGTWALGGSSTGDAGVGAIDVLQTLEARPLFRAAPGRVFDVDTNDFRQVVNYHITTYSNIPMDMPIVLLDALDQVASENTTLRQAQVRARYLNSTNGCKAELLGGIEGVARNGTAVMNAMRLRALKGENYSIEFKVEDSVFSGSVEPLVVNVTVPACLIGEVPRDNGYLCQKCDPRSFSLWLDVDPLVNCTYPNLSEITCLPCPDGGECPGGALVVPRQGLWHSAANSTSINPCQNQEACRDGDDEAQDNLVACQEWWYSRPSGFDYQAFADSVRDNNSTLFPDAPGALEDGTYNTSDPGLCVLWGLPYNHPASYAFKQCAEGYGGNLCAVCITVDGVMYAGNGDFECGQCFTRAYSTAIAIFGFLANVVTVLVTIVLTFLADYTEDEDLAIGDLLKVLIVHIQYFVIVTRLNIDWPKSVSGFTSAVSALTGAVVRVYAPSCTLTPDHTPAEAARINALAAIASPLLCVVFVAVLWIVRHWLFNFRNTQAGRAAKDMRTMEEYRHDRATRLAAKKRQDVMSHMDLESYFEEEEYNDPNYNPRSPDLMSGTTRQLLSLQSGKGESIPSRNGTVDGGVVAPDHIGVNIPELGSSSPPATSPRVPTPTRHTTSADAKGTGAGGGANGARCSGDGDAAAGGGIEVAAAHVVDVPQPPLPPPPLAPLPPPAAPPPPAAAEYGGGSPSLSPSPSAGRMADAAASQPPPPGGLTATPGGSSRQPRLPTIPSRGAIADEAADVGNGSGHSSGRDVDRINSIKGSRPASADRIMSIKAGGGGTDRINSIKSGGGGGADRINSIKSGGGGGTDRINSIKGGGGGPPGPEPDRSNSIKGAGGVRISWRRNTKKQTSDRSRASGRSSGGGGSDVGAGGGPGSGGAGGDVERVESRLEKLRRMLSMGSLLVKNFFTYDEEGAEEGEVRWASLANIDRTMTWWRQQLLVVMIACFILYPAWAQAVLQIFGCYYLDQGQGSYPEFQLAQWSQGYWLLNMNQECYSGEHARLYVPIGLVGIFVVCIGIPCLTFFTMWSHRTALRTVHVAQTYGFLYRRYNYDKYYGWEAISQLQTLLLVIVDVFGRVLAVYQQAVLLMGRDAIVRGVTVARETLVGATSKVQMGLKSGLTGITTGLKGVGDSVTTSASKVKSVTQHGLTTIKDQVRRRATTNLQ
ncbi:hypothetical protein GPECTOR_24g239 [Gonium pectorale]|uniref:Uncharacterized protein n=1 Tax=Gonium pectorale TaxID=33097 RepID=A0A150GGI0_GONPE|nr:hypothetical protein GPECTOR_24g239 [Gonium pectorale]|eukprot:KXZ48949.1 hypothetical protein GPECTOR_24g239 [Gonium pectorale]